MSIGGKKFNIRHGTDLQIELIISSPNSNLSKKITVKDAILDTGSHYTLMPTKYINGLKLIKIGEREIFSIYNEGKNIMFYMAKLKIDPVIDDYFAIGVADKLDPVIGMDLIVKWNTLIMGEQMKFEIVIPKKSNDE